MNFETLTPNLIVSDIPKSIAFYRDVLGFETFQTVPEQAPLVFAWMKKDTVNVFLNIPQTEAPGTVPRELVTKSHPGSSSMYIKLHGIDELAARVAERGLTPVIAMHTEFYGMKEFAVLDPDGYLIIFAEPVK